MMEHSAEQQDGDSDERSTEVEHRDTHSVRETQKLRLEDQSPEQHLSLKDLWRLSHEDLDLGVDENQPNNSSSVQQIDVSYNEEQTVNLVDALNIHNFHDTSPPLQCLASCDDDECYVCSIGTRLIWQSRQTVSCPSISRQGSNDLDILKIQTFQDDLSKCARADTDIRNVRSIKLSPPKTTRCHQFSGHRGRSISESSSRLHNQRTRAKHRALPYNFIRELSKLETTLDKESESIVFLAKRISHSYRRCYDKSKAGSSHPWQIHGRGTRLSVQHRSARYLTRKLILRTSCRNRLASNVKPQPVSLVLKNEKKNETFGQLSRSTKEINNEWPPLQSVHSGLDESICDKTPGSIVIQTINISPNLNERNLECTSEHNDKKGTEALLSLPIDSRIPAGTFKLQKITSEILVGSTQSNDETQDRSKTEQRHEIDPISFGNGMVVSCSRASSRAPTDGEMPGSTNLSTLRSAEVSSRGQCSRDVSSYDTSTTSRREPSGVRPVFNSPTLTSSPRRGAVNTVDLGFDSRLTSPSPSTNNLSVSQPLTPSFSIQSSSTLSAIGLDQQSSSVSERGDGSGQQQSRNVTSQLDNQNNNNNNNDEITKDNNINNNIDRLKPRSPPLVPSSPPLTRNPNAGAVTAAPIEPSKLSKIRQNHLASKKRDQMRSRNMKLPELSEHHELDSTTLADSETSSKTDVRNTPATSNTGPRPTVPEISVTGDSDGVAPPTPSGEPVTPSLPESFLRKLGLSPKRANSISEDKSLDTLSEKEIEGKFVSLSLAFKTDKLTIDQRVTVQERSRDLAEQNVDRELTGLRKAAEALTELLSNDQVTDIVQRIKQHIDVLEQAAARVSSRAEVYGAVQQERRMCQAMEVMVLHTENLKRIREREESELQEARKLLSERTGQGLGMDFDSSPSRRSMSVCAFNAGGRAMRRRSEVALPRVLGGTGSPSMTQISSLETLFPHTEYSKPNRLNLSKSQEDEEGEDAKSRFQSAVASTSMQHAVTATMRRVSMERRKSVVSTSLSDGSSPTTSPLLTVECPLKERLKEVSEETASSRKISSDEEAFRKGFEEGLKTQLSQELNELRDQQSSISQNLEQVMDRVEQANQDDNLPLLREETLMGQAATALIKLREKVSKYDWRANKNVVKSLAGIFLVFLAIVVMLFSPPRAKVFPKTEN